MKDSSYIRRIDNLGRIVVPRGIRERCGVEIGDSLEICYDEKAQTVTLKRYETDETRRKKWVDKWYDKFSNTFTATAKQVSNTTIVAWNGCIETTCCRRGDTYDRRTGIAICMAKLCGERIPEYI